MGTIYTRVLTKNQRAQQAAFFTPPVLTTEILDQLEVRGVTWDTAKVFDPACGGAAFLAPMSQRIAASLKAKGKTPTQILRHIERHVFGVELDPILCQLSKLAIRRALASVIGNTNKRMTLSIRKGDALRAPATPLVGYDVVVTNPPFRKISKIEQMELSQSFEFLDGGQQNIYAAFIGLAMNSLSDAGVAALVTPTSFMSGKSFTLLRRRMLALARVPESSS